MDIPLHVLIIEDSVEDTDLLVRDLRRGGYEPSFQRVDTPEDLSDALANREWDIIIADYTMPRFTGIDALAMVRDSGLDVPFIFVSGTIGEDVAVEAMKAGAQDYLIKGNLKRLVPAIKREVHEAWLRREKVHAESERYFAEERFRAVFEQAAMGIGIIGPAGRFLQTNRKLADMLGYSPEEMLQLTIADVTYPDDIGLCSAGLDRVRKGLVRSCRINERCSRKDGSIIWGRLTLSLVSDEAGQLKYFIGVIEDITVEHELGETVKRSEANLADAQRIAHLGSWEHDLVADKLVWSDEMYRIFGVDRQQFGGTYEDFLACIHRRDRETVKDGVSRAIRQRKPQSIQYRILHPDGEERIIHGLHEVFFDDSGRPVRASGTAQDVTEQRFAEEQLRKLSLAVEQSSNIILIANTEGVIEYVNRKFTEVTGYSAEEAIGRTPALFSSHLTEAQKYEEFWNTLISGHEWHGEFLNCKKSGEPFLCEEHIAPIRDKSGKITHFVAIESDITERRKTAEQIQRAQKMETAGRLAGGIAHDFNNLLTVIQGNLELLRERLARQPEACEFADRALHATGRSAELVNHLLTFSRRQFLRPQAVDVAALIGRIKDLLGSMLTETISLKISVPDNLWHSLIDPAQLENALLNLTLNARDAMPKGGVLSIEAANIELAPDGLPADSEVMPGSFVRITVTDTGTGMPLEVLERAFEPFFTTKQTGKGSGLGLGMVYGFVKQSGGHIEITSAPGCGTSIDMLLPKTEPERVAEAPKGEGRIPAGGQTILVVEDDPEVRKIAVTFLRELGYRPIDAANGPAAMAILESRETVDLLFTDIVMPGGMSGVELVRRALDLRPDIKLLFATGYAEETAPDNNAHGPVGEVLTKPYRKQDLARAVWSALMAPTYH